MEHLIIHQKIKEIRGLKVILDTDLAQLYGVETKRLNEAVKRNIKRFPEDFMFQLTEKEAFDMRSQIATSKSGPGGNRYLPFVFTEQGVAMLSGLLNSDIAIEVNISIMRAFVEMRKIALTHHELTEKLMEMEEKYDRQFTDVYEALNYLIKKEKLIDDQENRTTIGFK